MTLKDNWTILNEYQREEKVPITLNVDSPIVRFKNHVLYGT